MHLFRRLSLSLLISFALAGVPTALAGPLLADEIDQALKNYLLDETFLDKYIKSDEAIYQDACGTGKFVTKTILQVHEKGQTVEKLSAGLQAQPEIADILARNGLSARKYLLGNITLAQAEGLAWMDEDSTVAEEVPFSVPGIADRAAMKQNVAFVKAHGNEIQQHNMRIYQSLSGEEMQCMMDPGQAG